MKPEQLKQIIETVINGLEEKISVLGDEVQSIKENTLNIDNVLSSIKGQDGKMPVYGEDWTLSEEDIAKIQEAVKPIEGVDYTIPKDGKDAVITEELVSRITKLVQSKVKEGKDGKDGIDGLDGRDGVDGIDGKDGSSDTPKDIAKKINTLDNAIDWKVLKNYNSLVNQDTLKRGLTTLENQVRYLLQKNTTTSSTSGSGITLQQTFTFSDFADDGSGNGYVAFSGGLPPNAVPIGVTFEVTSAFDAASTLEVINSLAANLNIGTPVTADATGTFTGLPWTGMSQFNFTATPSPIVFMAGVIPTQGTVTVTVVYGLNSGGGGGGGTFTGTVAANQVAYGSATDVLTGDSLFIRNNSTKYTDILKDFSVSEQSGFKITADILNGAVTPDTIPGSFLTNTNNVTNLLSFTGTGDVGALIGVGTGVTPTSQASGVVDTSTLDNATSSLYYYDGSVGGSAGMGYNLTVNNTATNNTIGSITVNQSSGKLIFDDLTNNVTTQITAEDDSANINWQDNTTNQYAGVSATNTNGIFFRMIPAFTGTKVWNLIMNETGGADIATLQFKNNTDTKVYLNINPSTGIYQVGDTNSSLNGTYIEVDDTNQLFTLTNVPAYADDATATGAGLTTGQLYQTTTGGSTFLKIVP